ncbi:butyrophilin-like protein 1 [Betta splendens]|uniref:Butyrophilin-like protein 1 n=1 Tax=Betta splendens TaxID=158456 RepID=A0A9W2XB22_BETSP|nr:butyrophilin-like protein 1 [Betta splendens]
MYLYRRHCVASAAFGFTLKSDGARFSSSIADFQVLDHGADSRMFVLHGFHLLFQTLVVFALTLHSCEGRSLVVGPSQPIAAAVGDDVTLPCRLQPPADAVAMTVEWTRTGPDRRFVLVWRDGEELRNKHEAYEGRTSLLTDELRNGDVSLRLVHVRPSDAGTYRCFVPGLDSDAAVQLVVGRSGSVSSPVIHEVSNTSDVVVLECRSGGWFPEPELLWLDAEGKLLSAGPTETVRGSDDLYTVSSRVTVDKRHSSRYTCRVQQTSINHTSEAHIEVTGNIFPGQTDSRSSSGSSVLVVVGLILCIVVLLAAVAALVVWKRRKNKHGKKQQDEETQNRSGANEPEKEPLMEPERVTTQTVENQNEMKKTQTVKNLQTENVDKKPQRRENNSRSKETDNETIETDREQFREKRGENQSEMEETQTVENLQTEQTEAEDEETHVLTNEETQNKSEANEPEKEPLMEPETDGERVTTQTVENQNEMEKTQTVHTQNQETEETEAEDEEPHDQGLTDEGQYEELMERETLSDVDIEMETLKNKVTLIDGGEKGYDKNIKRKLGQIKDKEKQISDIKKQLKELETQREETEKKMMDPDSQKEAAETHQEVRDAKKVELQKQLKKTEEWMKRMMKEIVYMSETGKKHKTTKGRDETAKKTEEEKKQKNKNLKTTSDN